MKGNLFSQPDFLDVDWISNILKYIAPYDIMVNFIKVFGTPSGAYFISTGVLFTSQK